MDNKTGWERNIGERRKGSKCIKGIRERRKRDEE
jgi:hypothetical protein